MENFTKYPAFNGNVAVVDAKGFLDSGISLACRRRIPLEPQCQNLLHDRQCSCQRDDRATARHHPADPNPMSFATPPAALGQTSITMTATTASDPSGVQYFFECTAGGGHSSGWQDSPTYTDTGLTRRPTIPTGSGPATRARPKTATAWSAAASATTARPTPSRPTPNPMSFAVAAHRDLVKPRSP